MYPTAPNASGDLPNHSKFSQKSIANISAVLDFVLKWACVKTNVFYWLPDKTLTWIIMHYSDTNHTIQHKSALHGDWMDWEPIVFSVSIIMIVLSNLLIFQRYLSFLSESALLYLISIFNVFLKLYNNPWWTDSLSQTFVQVYFIIIVPWLWIYYFSIRMSVYDYTHSDELFTF